MSTPAGTSEAPLPQSQPVARAEVIIKHPFHWALKRELWEHRSLYIAPIVVAGIVLLGGLLNAVFLLNGGVEILVALAPEKQRAVLGGVYAGVGSLLMVVMSIVAWFYCLDALHGERRDRSILFWKSLPVSDLATVLAKLSVPGVAIPVITFVFSVALQLALLILATIVVAVAGHSPVMLWTQTPFFEMVLMLAYGIVVTTLWYAPIYGWLLLVSSWARRSTFLWAVMPPFGVCLLEKMAFGTNHFLHVIAQRLFGWSPYVASGGMGRLEFDEASRTMSWSQMMAQVFRPTEFLSDPGLWLGLVAGAAFVAAATWMRRYREPL